MTKKIDHTNLYRVRSPRQARARRRVLADIRAAQSILANEGFDTWLAALPEEDWTEDYERAALIDWD